MIFLLDTDMLIYMIRGLKAAARRQVRERARGLVDHCQKAQKEGHAVGVSAITVSELEFGARKSRRYDEEIAAVQKILMPFDIYDYVAVTCAPHYGQIRHELEQAGETIGAMDLLSAAHGAEHGRYDGDQQSRTFPPRSRTQGHRLALTGKRRPIPLLSLQARLTPLTDNGTVARSSASDLAVPRSVPTQDASRFVPVAEMPPPVPRWPATGSAARKMRCVRLCRKPGERRGFLHSRTQLRPLYCSGNELRPV